MDDTPSGSNGSLSPPSTSSCNFQQKLDDFAQFAKGVFDSGDEEKKLELYNSMKQYTTLFEKTNIRAKKRKLHETLEELKSMREIKVQKQG